MSIFAPAGHISSHNRPQENNNTLPIALLQAPNYLRIQKFLNSLIERVACPAMMDQIELFHWRNVRPMLGGIGCGATFECRMDEMFAGIIEFRGGRLGFYPWFPLLTAITT